MILAVLSVYYRLARFGAIALVVLKLVAIAQDGIEDAIADCQHLLFWGRQRQTVIGSGNRTRCLNHSIAF